MSKDPLAVTYAVRCPGKAGEKEVAACRSHLAAAVDAVQPQRILVIGSVAAHAFLGRPFDAAKTSKGYAWTSEGIPVFMLPDPTVAKNRRYARRRFIAALNWALTVEDDLIEGPIVTDYHLIETLEDSEKAARELSFRAWVAFDTETEGIMHTKHWKINTFAACGEGMREVYVWGRKALESRAIRQPLEMLLEEPKIGLVAHNAKFDFSAVWNAWGVLPTNLYADTLVLSKMLQSNADGKLDTLAAKVGMYGHKEEAQAEIRKARVKLTRVRKGEPWGTDSTRQQIRRYKHIEEHPGTSLDAWAYGEMNEEVRDRYCARDALATAMLCEHVERELRDDAATCDHWNTLVRPAIGTLIRIEHRGVKLDTIQLDCAAVYYRQQMEAAEAKIAEVTGRIGDEALNPASPKELAIELFEVRGLRPLKRTPTGAPSTDVESLRKYSSDPLVKAVLEYRDAQKRKRTYVDGLRVHMTDDGRVHPSLNPSGTETGRLSCSSPNLQNIPRPSGAMFEARAAFIAPAGRVFLDADFSQIELRVAAGLSMDRTMEQVFVSGEDYHLSTARYIASEAWGLSPEQVGPKHRTIAKTVNFGLLYGQSSMALAKSLDISIESAERVKNAVLSRFSQLAKWISERLASACVNATTTTMWEGLVARRRQLWDIDHPDSYRRSSAERASWNTAIQGTAADFCLAALVDVDKWLREEHPEAFVVMTVHDSIVVEAPDDKEKLDIIALGMKRIMESRKCGDVPISADVKVGKTWGGMKDYQSIAQELAKMLGVNEEEK